MQDTCKAMLKIASGALINDEADREAPKVPA